MIWFEIRRSWKLWRQLDGIHRALWNCKRNPDKIKIECQRLEVSEQAMHLVMTIFFDRKDESDVGLQLFENGSLLDIESAKRFESTKKMILEFLELSIAKENSSLVCEEIGDAAQAAATGDDCALAHFAQVFRLAREEDTAELANAVDHKDPEENNPLAEILIDQQAVKVADVIGEQEPLDWELVGHLIEQIQRHSSVHALIQDFLEDFARPRQGHAFHPSFEAAHLTILRHRIGDISEQLAVIARLDRNVVDRFLDSLHDHTTASYTRREKKGKVPARGTREWSLLVSLSKRKKTINNGLARLNFDISTQGNMKAAAPTSVAIREESNNRVDERIWEDLRWIFASDYFKKDPNLAMRIVAEHCRRHKISWDSCLRLANESIHPYQYLYQKVDPEDWDVKLACWHRVDGSYSIPFTVTQQPLQSDLYDAFDKAGFVGRVNILWHMVQLFREFRDPALTIRIEDIDRLIKQREANLLERIQITPESLLAPEARR